MNDNVIMNEDHTEYENPLKNPQQIDGNFKQRSFASLIMHQFCF